jgi:hypothetical protein
MGVMADPRTDRYVAALAAVREVVNGLDPVGLIAGGAPEDEYGPEVADLVRLVMRPEPFDEETVDAVWRRWFGDDYTMAGSERLREQTLQLTEFQSQFGQRRRP